MPAGRASARVSRRHAPSAAVSATALCCLAACIAVASCSNQQSSVNRRSHPGTVTASPVDGVQQVVVQALDTDRFDPSTITVHPGMVRIIVQNVGNAAPHNLTFNGFPAATPLVAAGQNATLTFTAPAPGTYSFVCTIHIKQGMTGTLVVLPS